MNATPREKKAPPQGRKPSYGDAIRLVRIVLGLNERRSGWALDHIRDELGISERTLSRYVRALREEIVDREGRSLIEVVRYESRRVLRFRNPSCPPDANVYEVASLHFLLASRRCLEGTVLWDGASGLLGRMLHGMAHEQRARLAHLDRKFFSRERPARAPYARHDQDIDLLLRSLIDGRRVRIRYRRGKRVDERNFDPYTLACGRDGLEVTGHCHLENEVVTLSIRRILGVEKVYDSEGRRQGFRYPLEYDPAQTRRASVGASSVPASQGRILRKPARACSPRRARSTQGTDVEPADTRLVASGSRDAD